MGWFQRFRTPNVDGDGDAHRRPGHSLRDSPRPVATPAPDQAAGIPSEHSSEEYAPGEWIYREGEEGTLLFLLLAGEVELTCAGRVFARLVAPDFFGELSALGTTCRADSARALNAVRALPIGPARLGPFTGKHPSLIAVFAMAARRRGEARAEAAAAGRTT